MPTPQSLSLSSTRSPIAVDAYVHPGHSNHVLVSNTIVYSVIAAATASLDVIVGRPLVTYSSAGAVTIQLPYYCRAVAHSLTSTRLLALQSLLARHLDRPVTLRVTYLTQPYLDATILARYVSAELLTQGFSRVMRKLLSVTGPLDATTASRIALPSCLLGLSISLDGRLSTEPTRPRMTKQSVTIGSVSQSLTSQVQLGSHTAFNVKGAYTVSVCLSTRLSIPSSSTRAPTQALSTRL